MLKQKRDDRVCNYCNLGIEFSEDRFVIVTIVDKGKIIEEVYFHINCWKSYFRDRVAQKVDGMRNQALNLLGNLKKQVGEFQGSGTIEKMLKTPITKEEREEWKNKEKKK